MKKVFKYVLVILFWSFATIWGWQSKVNAVEINTIRTIEELKTAFGEKATINGNVIQLTDNVTIKDNPLGIEIPNVIIDFNGKIIKCDDYGSIYVYKNVTLKDSSTVDRTKWGGINFDSRAASIDVKNEGELIIENGKFIDCYNGDNYNYILKVNGKMKINDATFCATRTQKETHWSRSMIRLFENSETIINNGDFYNLDRIIECQANDSYKNNSKLTINGGNFKSTDESDGTISITSLYPYIDANNNKEIITPTIILNNCSVESKNIAIKFAGGSTEKEYRNENTKILTINGGTYKCSGIAALEISTYLSPFTYFNPKDFAISNGKFEALVEGASAMRLDGPKKR